MRMLKSRHCLGNKGGGTMHEASSKLAKSVVMRCHNGPKWSLDR